MLHMQQNKYLQTSIQTATPAQLLLMLYDGAIRFCRMGIAAIKEKKYDAANTNLCKVQDIIRELAVTLDKSAPVAEGLLPLYDYFLERLIHANVTKTAEPAEEVLGYLLELKETWAAAAKASQLQAAGSVNHA